MPALPKPSSTIALNVSPPPAAAAAAAAARHSLATVVLVEELRCAAQPQHHASLAALPTAAAMPSRFAGHCRRDG